MGISKRLGHPKPSRDDTSTVSRRLNASDFRILVLSALGGAVEFYDFVIFVFMAPLIGKLFFPPDIPEWLAITQTFGIFAAGYLLRPLGGVVLAHFGDIFGRKRVFAFSILLMTLSMLGIALMPTYVSIGMFAPMLLIAMRVLQGIAIGGEVPGAWTFVAEHMPSRRVGLACGILCSGLTLGITLASLTAGAINFVFGPEDLVAFAWRIPFLVGGASGLIAVYLRQWLRETPIFLELKRRRMLSSELPLIAVIRDHPRGIIVSILLTWILSAIIVVTALMTPTFLHQLYGYNVQESLAASSFGSIFLILGATGAGAIIDRIRPGVFFIAGSLFFGMSTFIFYSYAAVSLEVLLFLHALMGLGTAMAGAAPYVMVRAFPARVRFTGVSFSYNSSYAFFGGLTPIIIVTVLPHHSMAHAYYLLFIAALTFALGVYMLMNEDGLESEFGTTEAFPNYRCLPDDPPDAA